MDTKKVVQDLQKLYPGREIVKNNEEQPTEIICEVEPTAEHPEYSVAIAVIDQSQEHFHKEATETYEVISSGELKVHKDDKKCVLSHGGKIIILPGEKHFAEGNSVWVRVTSKPGWKKEDHYFL